jgi:hypothetical protein
VVIDACNGNPAITHGVDEHAEAGQVGDVEDDDQVGPAELLYGLRRAVHTRQVVEEEAEPGGSRARVRNRGGDSLAPKQVHQSHLTAEPVAIGVYVRGDADSLARLEDHAQ